MSSFIESPEEVLSTLTKQGKRKWIYPKVVEGLWFKRRQVLAWCLILFYIVAPFIKVNGKPFILLDLVAREFTFLGTTFLATDSFIFLLSILSVLIIIVGLTALFGRVWCGWACPQTVYLEFVFRPIERLILGSDSRQKKLDKSPWTISKILKKGLLYAVFTAVASVLANAFIAYFIGGDTLIQWMQLSPAEHPIPFVIMLGVSAAVLFDFAYFREQMCTIACPYARLQSVLLDNNSIAVGYDSCRGEPRGKGKDRDDKGDCVDCGLCHQVCPTGIDIRNGLQMECVNCTQCIDACDSIMHKLGKPLGLIRYASQVEFEGGKTKFLRPRTVFYSVIAFMFVFALSTTLVVRSDTDIKVLKRIGEPYFIREDGKVTNHLRVKIQNKGAEDRNYTIVVSGSKDLEVVIPVNPIAIKSGGSSVSNVFVSLTKESLNNNSELKVNVHLENELLKQVPVKLTGPRG